MFGWLQRLGLRRRLRPIITRMPLYLAKAFGAQQHYTAGQIRRAVAEFKLPQALEAYALAAFTAEADVAKAGLDLSTYQKLRADRDRLFDLGGVDFGAEQLLRRRIASSWNPLTEGSLHGGETWPGHHN